MCRTGMKFIPVSCKQLIFETTLLYFVPDLKIVLDFLLMSFVNRI